MQIFLIALISLALTQCRTLDSKLSAKDTLIQMDEDEIPGVLVLQHLNRKPCAGVLVSENTVLFAGHCSQEENSLSFGKPKLQLPSGEMIEAKLLRSLGTYPHFVMDESKEWRNSSGFDLALAVFDHNLKQGFGLAEKDIFEIASRSPLSDESLDVVGVYMGANKKLQRGFISGLYLGASLSGARSSQILAIEMPNAELIAERGWIVIGTGSRTVYGLGASVRSIDLSQHIGGRTSNSIYRAQPVLKKTALFASAFSGAANEFYHSTILDFSNKVPEMAAIKSANFVGTNIQLKNGEYCSRSQASCKLHATFSYTPLTKGAESRSVLNAVQLVGTGTDACKRFVMDATECLGFSCYAKSNCATVRADSVGFNVVTHDQFDDYYRPCNKNDSNKKLPPSVAISELACKKNSTTEPSNSICLKDGSKFALLHKAMSFGEVNDTKICEQIGYRLPTTAELSNAASYPEFEVFLRGSSWWTGDSLNKTTSLASAPIFSLGKPTSYSNISGPSSQLPRHGVACYCPSVLPDTKSNPGLE